MPISRHVAEFLPTDRPFTELEALYSVQLDYYNKRRASVSGYSKRWGWSRKKVDSFLLSISAEIRSNGKSHLGGVIIPTSGASECTSPAQVESKSGGKSRASQGQVRLIVINGLDDNVEQVWSKSGASECTSPAQVESKSGSTTIEIEMETENDIQLPPLPPAGGSEAGEEGEGGDDQPPDPPPPPVADPPPEQTGRKKRVKKETPPESEKFLIFWAAYPNKQGRAKAWEKWAEWKLDSQADAIMAALDGFRRSEGWLKDSGQFIPHGSTWINQRRWLDMAEVAAPRQPARNAAPPRPMPNSRELAERLAQERYEEDMRRNQL